MCGICGEFRFDGAPVDRTLLEKMTEKLANRGPDDQGVFLDANVGFGHRRLSVIDLSTHSHQPMIDPDLDLALVFNGAIYNYQELRKELQQKGYRFYSEGDTEVILKAYHCWGDECPKHLHGMFAFVIWDKSKQILFMARDRFGIKPLYFSQTNHSFSFASTPQALLVSSEVDRSIDPISLHFQYSLHAVIPAPGTILKGIRKLEPGHFAKVDVSGKSTSIKYWELDATRGSESLSEQEWVEAVQESLKEAVRKRNDVADVPVGVLLSGGLDSSLLVALLAELGSNDLHTFSVGFEDQPEEKGSEFEFSDLVVDRYQPNHHKFLVPNNQVLQRMPEAVDAMSEPMFGQDAVAFYLLSEQVSKNIKVVQSGQGADEVFGGYFWYQRMMDETAGELVDRFRKHYFDRDHPEFLRMVGAQFKTTEDVTRNYVSQRLKESGADEFIDAILRFDVTTLVVDDPVKRVDNMTMAWGLEARVPFLDHELVELVARCPPEIKFQTSGKHLLKRIARGIIPDEVIDRPKGYFPMPALKYVRGEFLEFMQDILHSKACRERGVFDRLYIEQLMAAPDMYLTRIQGSKLWHLALFEYWMQRVVD